MKSNIYTEKEQLEILRERDALMEPAHRRCRDEEQFACVQKAYELAATAHNGVRLHSGMPFIIYPLQVARIVVEKVGLGYHSICAALLLGILDNTSYTVDDIRNLFDDKTARLSEGLRNISKVLENSGSVGRNSESEQAENLKMVLLTMGDDVRLVLIKMAEMLHFCRNLEKFPAQKRESFLSQAMFIFIPLAHRLGLYAIKSELENLWLRFRHPEEYADISGRIDKDVAQRAHDLDEFIEPISNTLREKGYVFEIKKRIKTPYSIWYKMRTKHVPFEQIYDLYAVRIIFDPATSDPDKERDQAYLIYSAIGKLYRDKPNRQRDWIKHPKSNGYEALHCTLMSKTGFWVEVQIRSRRMDDIAEKGIAAHWAYKHDGYLSESDSQVDTWLAKVKDILSSDDTSAIELLDIIQDEVGTSEIVVFTPKGDQRTLPKGSTALDFAYFVHTNVGNSAIAAKVNQKLAPLSRVLRAGDQVEIITARKASPKVEWLAFLKTRRAKRCILEFIRANSPDELGRAEEYLAPSEYKSDEAAELPIRIVLRGVNRPGLTSEIENVLRRIEGIEDVEISDE
ncbi:MAG: bifunctional (p)ppGpp synthetase/guanosine-3',5'-bis(diphosphate) 3'-pyrophosphohydrolase [Bacteroidales bacterium]|nr:bifunctional (p)ppGpp synthetase/guanosine-3',5'-bis(diphosphate) 3'-pyrophosphohydrolase [Bacteroidales bacterium]